ncbi:hypothetical protein PS691_01268 [Pseudomonas fluorescens]|uniref:Response regulatory domain-containing protein n=1 Tax=Pseudomonas fluorescens TaxID=294 RepID=A0A5E7B307_PSEFL|nr:hypothetical protein PS691_01268 [Pseudomonas fluorescens]
MLLLDVVFRGKRTLMAYFMFAERMNFGGKSPLITLGDERFQQIAHVVKEWSSHEPNINRERKRTPSALILVVEDEPVILEFLCEILQQEGFTTEAKGSADAAMEFLDRYADNVCLLLTEHHHAGEFERCSLGQPGR